MRESRASKGVTQGDTQPARVAVSEAYTMSLDLKDKKLQGCSLFWIGVVEFYDGNAIAAAAAIRAARTFEQWELPEEVQAWLEKWSLTTKQGTRPSQKPHDYNNLMDARVPRISVIKATHDVVRHTAMSDDLGQAGFGEDAKDEEGKEIQEAKASSEINRREQVAEEKGLRVDGEAAKSAETKSSRWNPLSYYI
jgi:hypothetical protein